MAPSTATALGRWRRPAAALLATATLAGLTAACAPPEPTVPQDPTNIVSMTDAQVVERLEEVAPDVQEVFSDPAVLAEVPEENRADVDDIVAKLGTADGRAQLVDRLREETQTTRGGFLQGRENIAGGILDTVVALSDGFEVDTSLHGTRSPAPATAGVSVGFESTSGPCNAPGGTGTLAAPDSLVPDQHLSPEHDVFARYNPGLFDPNLVTFIPPFLEPTGAPTISGGAGVEFRRGGSTGHQMRVQVDLQDVNKNFPVAALYPLFRIRPLAGTAAQEIQVFPSEGSIRCYAGDDETDNRAYFDGWIDVPPSEPGFQLITEVVENDFYFRFGGPSFDLLLSADGPQYFAGADRSTIHIGDAPLTDAAPLDHSVGAFATAFQDPGGAPNVLTEQNGVPADDLEAAIAGMLESKVTGALSDELSGILSNYYAITVWGNPAERPEAEVDIRWVDPHTRFPGITGEVPGRSGAVEAAIHATAKADIGMQVLGTPCTGLTLDVELDSVADVWADSAGPDTGIVPRFEVSTDPDTDVDMPWYDWPLANCVIGYGILSAKSDGKVSDGVDGALDDALGEDGSITKLLQGFDLNDYLPDLVIDPISIGSSTTGGAVMKPVVTNLDNAWCRAIGPAGCSVDQDLLGTNGLEVAADATMVSSLAQALGGPLGGRFPNVFAPSRTSTVDDLVTTHTDNTGQFAGLGVVVDPRLVNLALRALVQGTATGTTTNGLIDIRDFELPISGFSISLRPEVAPMMTANTGLSGGPAAPASSPTVRAVAPDVRLDLRTAPDDLSSIRYSVAATVNAGAEFEPATGTLRPALDSPVIDIQTTGGCQVDYGDSYALSYFFCGRGAGGNGGEGITSLNDLLDQIANAVVLPLIDSTVGGIGLPSLDGVIRGARLALTNVRFAQRGGFLAAYADLRPAPSLRLVGSTAGYGSDEDTIRFFAVPTNVDIVNTPTTFDWEITDAETGQPVAFTYFPGAGQSAVQFPSNAFVPDSSTGYKTVNGKLTLDQPGLHVVGNGSFSWRLREPVPPPNCPPPPPGGFLRSLQSLPGGVGGYGTIGLVVC